MGLKIHLKPQERVIIGGALLRNGHSPAEFLVENEVPILRQKDVLTEAQADTPCKRVYFVIQAMYLDPENLGSHHQTYWTIVSQVVNAAPSTRAQLSAISEEILDNRYYKALKLAKKLIEYEHELLSRT